MGRYVVKRLITAIPVMLMVAVLTFLLMHLLPGDPATVIAGPDADPSQVERIRQQLGLNEPLWAQLGNWFVRLAHGDFGHSIVLQQSVVSAFAERLPVTLSLTALAMAFTLPVGIALGIVAAYWRNSSLDAFVMAVALAGVSIPNFWTGILSIILFSVILGWVPSSGYAPLSAGVGPWFMSIVVPSAVLALFQVGLLARVTRSAMLDVLDQNYVRTARAKGVSEWRTISKHAFRNTLIQVVTIIGVILSLLLGGTVVTEQVFALPGIGRLIVQGIFSRDYPLVQGALLIVAFAFVALNLLVDIVYTWVDPRVSYD